MNTNLLHTLTKRGISNNDNNNITPYFVIAETPSFFDFRPVNGVYPENPFTSSNPLQTIAYLRTPEDVFRQIGSLNAQYAVFTTATQNLKATLDAGVDHYAYTTNIFSPPIPAVRAAGRTSRHGNQSRRRRDDGAGRGHRSRTSTRAARSRPPPRWARGADTTPSARRTSSRRTFSTGQQNVDRGSAVQVFENRTVVRSLSLFAQEEVLLLDQRLLLTGGILGQRSTNNPDVNKFFYYPKAAASYRFPQARSVDELKFRAAYGETGNEPIYGQKFTSFLGSRTAA